MVAVSTSWTSPDARRTVAGTAFGRPYERTEPAPPPVREDVVAGLLTVAVTALLGAPVGLLWALLGPDVEVVVEGEGVRYADPFSDALIAVDGAFLAAVVVAGLVGGLVAERLARRHGPAVVVGLVLGGFAAAHVASVVGAQYGLEGLRAAIREGGQGRYSGFLELTAPEALVGWPVASLLAYVAVSLLRGR